MTRPKAHIQRVMHSSDRVDWRTPPELFAALHREFRFTCDLAADRNAALLPRFFGPGSDVCEDALYPGRRWTGRGFLNPPYSVKRAAEWEAREPVSSGRWFNPFKIENWVRKAYEESRKGWTGVTVIPFSPQTLWYRRYVYGHTTGSQRVLVQEWRGHAAVEERRLQHRVTFLRPDGTVALNAPGNTVVIVWRPNPGYVGPWGPVTRYWEYLKARTR